MLAEKVVREELKLQVRLNMKGRGGFSVEVTSKLKFEGRLCDAKTDRDLRTCQ